MKPHGLIIPQMLLLHPVTKSDELGQLSQAFNAMTQRLDEMITAKEQLLRDVSHELRSPLARMKVALEFVKESRTRELVQSDIQEMEEMITHILETARMHHDHSRLDLQKVDLTRLIDDVVTTVAARCHLRQHRGTVSMHGGSRADQCCPEERAG